MMPVMGKSLGPGGHHPQWPHKPQPHPIDRPRGTPTATPQLRLDPTQRPAPSAFLSFLTSFHLQPLLSLQRFSSLQKGKETPELVRLEISLTTSPLGRAQVPPGSPADGAQCPMEP